MKKKIIIGFLIVFIIALFTVLYLNGIYFPSKIRHIVTDSLRKNFGLNAEIKNVKFSFTKGVILEAISVSKDGEAILNAKEVSFGVLWLPVFSDRLVIANLKIDGVNLWLKRLKDGNYNIGNISRTRKEGRRDAVNFFILGLSLSRGNIYFKDESNPASVPLSLVGLKANVSFSSSGSVSFNGESALNLNPASRMKASGRFDIVKKRLILKINVANLPLPALSPYVKSAGLEIKSGVAGAVVRLVMDKRLLDIDFNSQEIRNVKLSIGQISCRVNAGITANLKYNLTTNQYNYSAAIKLKKTDVTGVKYLEDISELNGTIYAGNNSVRAPDLHFNLSQIPVSAAFEYYASPVLRLKAKITLNTELPWLKERFAGLWNYDFPVEVQGRARAEFFIDTGFPLADGFPFEAVLSVRDAAIKFSQLPIHLSRVNGLFEVNRKRLKWSKVNFLYDGENCSSEGLLDNFENPAVDIKLRSKNIELISIFNRKGNLVNLSKLQFRFRGSNISSSGTFNLSNPGAIDANLKVTASADLKDIGPILKIPESTMLILKPSGIIDIRGDISGDIRDLKTCLVDARIKSNSFSFYGLKAQRLNLVYFQKDGLAELKDSRLGFYEGSIEFGMRLNVGARSLPFAAQAIIDGVKLENIGNDIKGAEDLAGTVKLNAELNGFLNDISTLSGSGDIFISNGRIWELNLFKGIGKLVFTKNYFAKIIFKEGAASFVIADKTVNCEKVNLKGDIANLEGSVKIGLDGSLNAVLNVEVLDDMVPLTGSFKDVTTAIMGEAGRFGVIRITGTLKEPKYKFRPAVVDIIKGIKNTFFGE